MKDSVKLCELWLQYLPHSIRFFGDVVQNEEVLKVWVTALSVQMHQVHPEISRLSSVNSLLEDVYPHEYSVEEESGLKEDQSLLL